MARYQFESTLWKYNGHASWYFVDVPQDISENIKKSFSAQSAAWGTLKVDAIIDSIQWQTSLFFDRKRGGYLLPVKQKIRKSLGLEDESVVVVILKINKEESLF